MKAYYFDAEPHYSAETDRYPSIAGKDYEVWVDTCFRYSDYFSLDLQDPPSRNNFPAARAFCNFLAEADSSEAFERPIKVQKAFEPFLLEKKFSLQNYPSAWSYAFLEPKFSRRRYYKVREETRGLLLSLVNDLWDFHPGDGTPENPIFYRKDDSVLFTSVTHDNWCILYPRDGEDFGELLRLPIWECREVTRNWIPNADVLELCEHTQPAAEVLNLYGYYKIF